ncbi:MATE family efflux transporter [Sphaerimonospora thailandensis]|uniref:MATE family efflux transporter n=1 Tax=Sphaerimonospora thailandensis TaxID=795644 RepID=A0A8J3W051_9ACTN|nr:MATE family efflux transporter [Sphaerimonospora thailandensis]GIH71192.1 MATE family efflux transporter [Sphaerimonospora thailandensis]
MPRTDEPAEPAVEAVEQDRRRRSHDREILRLAVPAFGALVAEPLFLLTDSVIVGRLPDPALGALGVAGAALAALVGLCVFLAYATTASVARQVGAGDVRQAMRQGIDGLWLAAAIGLVVSAACWPLAPFIVHLFGATGELAAQAVTYLRVSLFGIPAMLLVLAGTGVLRGMQDTRTPLVVSVASFALNGLLSLWFVLGLGWGIAGSAWGTVAAQALSAAVYLTLVVRTARRHGAPLRPDLVGLRAAGAAGFALVIRTACLQTVLLVATSIATRMGDDQIGAHTIAARIWTFLAFALDAIAIAGQAITGRTLGAGDAAATRDATARMVRWGIACGLVFCAAVLLTRPLVPGVFDANAGVTAHLLAVLWPVALFQPVAGVVFVLDGVLIGAGDQRYLAWAGLWATIAYLPFAALAGAAGSMVALWLALGAWMVARLITLGIRAYGTAWLVTGA